MADTNGTFADFSDEDDTQDINLDDLDNLPDKDPIVKNLTDDFSVEPTPSKVMTRQSISHNREHMKVYLRIRPFTDKEVEKGESQDTMKVDSSSCLIMQAPKDSFTFKSSQRGFGDMTHKFTFTNIFGQDTNQKSLFDDTMLGTVKDFVDGQNCLVFTYGVTNAGKTYTIQGTPQDGGILPRSLDVVFNSIEGRQFNSMRLKPRMFCDVVRLNDIQIQKEVDLKKKVLSMAECEPPKQMNKSQAADKSQIDKSTQDMFGDSSIAESDVSRGSHYSTATEESLSESTQDASKLMDGIPNVWEDIRSRIPDDTSIDVEAQGPIKFSIWVSFAEIYNEYIYDLLEEIPKGKKARRQPLKLSSDKHGSIYIKGLKEIQVDNADEAYRVLKIGQNNRSIASTKLNQCSSRSHCIFSVKILRVVDCDEPRVARVSKLSFCDLAGSERYTKTHNTGDRLKEAGNINTSLLTLGKCIHTLRYNQNHPKIHPKIIPFRESKLTRLFQSFFLGKGKAHMIVNVNQCASGFDETLHVLKFSAIAKQVTTVTSKLDNKWKERKELPSKLKLASARTVSLVINQSLDSKKKEVRPSIAWATPGTAKAVAEELEDIEESVLEDEDDDLELTPVGERADDNEAMVELKNVIEVLKSKLIEEKQKSLDLEANLREEICQEMAQQIVQIEEDYNERLREEQEYAEEKFEKKLELYTKSVKKAKKRKRKEEDDVDDDEYVSSALLAAEQVKVQQRDGKIEDLEVTIEKLKSESSADEEKMSAQNQTVMELESLVESTKVALQEANERLCKRESELKAYKETASAEASRQQELQEKIDALMNNQERTREEVAEARQASEETHTELGKARQALEETRAELKDTKFQASEAGEEIKKLNNELHTYKETSSSQLQELKEKAEALKDHESTCEGLKQQIAAHEREAKQALEESRAQLKEKDDEITELKNAKFQASEAGEEIKKLNNELQKYKETSSTQASQMQELKEKAEALMKDHKSTCEGLKQQIAAHEREAKQALEESHAQLKEKDDEITELKKAKFQASEAGEEIKKLKAELQTYKETSSTQASQLQELKEKAEALMKDQERTCEGLKQQIAAHAQEAKQALEESHAQLKEKDDEITELKNAKFQASEAGEEIKKLNNELQTYKEASTTAKKEYQRLQFKAQESEAAVKDGESVTELLKNQVRTVEADFEKEKQTAEELRSKVKELEDSVADLQLKFDEAKNQVKTVKADLEKEKQTTQELTNKVKELEDTLADLQERFDEANETGREASGRLRNLEESLNQVKQDLSDEKAAHEKSKEAASGYEARISEMRISLEMSERTATSMAKQVKRTKDLKEELETTELLLKKKTEEANKLANVSGDASQMRSKVESLEEKLHASEQQLGVTKHTLQETLSRCSSLEQSLESKKDCVRDQQSKIEKLEEELEAKRSEVTRLQENQTQHTGDAKQLEENCRRLEQELSKKTSTINMLMKKMEQKCQEVKTAQQQVKSTEKDLDTLKVALQDQEETMTQQDKLLSDKEEENKDLKEELETLQDKYDALMKTSSEDQKSLRQAQRDLAKFNSDKSAQEKSQGAKEAELEKAKEKEEELTKELKTLKETLEETNVEVRDLEKELSVARTNLTNKEEQMEKVQQDYERTQLEVEKMQEQCERSQKELKERRKEVTELRERMDGDDAEEMKTQLDLKESKIAELESKLEEQEKLKEEQLDSWRMEKDTILKALEGELKRLRDKSQRDKETLNDKEKYIDQLQKELQEQMSQSAAFTEDDESDESVRRATRKSSGRSSRNTRSKRASKADSFDPNTEESDYSEPVKGRSSRRTRKTLQAVKEEPILIEDSPGVKKDADVLKEEVPAPVKDEKEEEPIYEEPPSDICTSSSASDFSGRQPSMVILEPDETDSSRVEMNVTPLQKNTRKTRNTRRGKKRKSSEMELEEGKATGTRSMKAWLSVAAGQFKKHGGSSTALNESNLYTSQEVTASGSRRKGVARNTRGRRRTRAACRDETEETENQPSGYTADGPLPPPGRSSRKALSKIGDMFQNSPFGKSAGGRTNSPSSRTRTAKKLVDNMQSPKQSPPRTVEVTVFGAETKKRRKLYKTEISTPYDCSPYETLSQQVEGTKEDDPPRPTDAPPKKTEGIVTRKLRSRQKKNKADY